ncbi:hypothetical protein BDN70DRAFT_795187 [Pholiota conissans]|uniref:Transforming growth factor beta regulator 1 n=1 Tax=Pholiota conissans TaxID=109636 RepID=A0A9P6D6N6_9AGAR|nr:hypothetical protein BDN70DRAFT_795187 [Pholiota conissans]
MYPLPPTFQSPAQQQQQRPPPSANQQGGRPKRLKSHTVTTKSFSIPMVPRDRGGKPMLPLNVGIMTVINLGEICVREHFHTERYIFPVGYEVTRRYLSTLNPNIEVVYHCTILDGGDGPKFQIIPSDRPDKPIIAGTATGAWSNIVKQANAIRNRQHSNSVSGPDFFGLGQNTIKHLLQELPNSDRLRDYVWQNFVEGGPLGGRHAAVIPALPEEWDSSMPLGAYYPKRDSNPNPGVARGLSHYPRHIIAQAEAQKAARLAEEQTQLQQQQQPIAGPSGLGSASSSATASQHINQHELPHIMLSLGATTGGSLNIQEYQPPPNQSHTADKRTTRSDGVTNTNSASSPSATARSTRAQGNHQQPQQQATPVNGAETSALNADGSMATTFASIMNAYPVPGVSTPQMSGQPTASTS